MMGILEAVEMLLGRGFQPDRTVYLAFGHDEEVGGRNGAAAIAALLAAAGGAAGLHPRRGRGHRRGLDPGGREARPP